MHRPSQGKIRNVYASRSELDAWRSQRRDLAGDDNARGRTDDEDQPVAVVEELSASPDAGAPSPRVWSWWPILAVGFLVVAGLTASLIWLAGTRAGVTFDQGDYVLISQFENLTGETQFDGALEYALERELSNSSFVRVVQPERVGDALRLMQLPVDTVVDAEVGREVALRDGGIRVVLTGRVEQLGPNYVLTEQLLDPQDGRVLASVSEDARDDGAISEAVRRLSSQVRARLGEALALIEASEGRLEKVTTPSLRALQLYSRGYAQYGGGQGPAAAGRRTQMLGAAELFRQAIAEDPHFASAHVMLGYSLRQQGRPLEEYLPHFERAVDLSASTTERDRLFIEGSYYSQTGQHEEAIGKYEALLRLHPDHYYATNNLGRAYRILGRQSESAPLAVRRADLRPNDERSQFYAARLLTGAWQLDRAKVYLRRASALSGPETPIGVVWRAFFPAYEHWFRGELEEAFSEVEAVAQTLPARSASERDAYTKRAGSFYLAFGRLRKARELFESLSDANARSLYLSWLADCLDDEAGTRAHLRAFPPNIVDPGGGTSPLVSPLRWVRAGLELERVDLRNQLGREPAVGYWELAWGELALRRGETSEAIERLERGLELTRGDSLRDFFLGSESLATAWQRLGNETQALRVLEDAAQAKAQYHNARLTGAFGRFRVQATLAREYRKLGRVQEAEAIEAEVLRMLKYADADHPIIRQIRASQASYLSSSDSPVSTSAQTAHP